MTGPFGLPHPAAAFPAADDTLDPRRLLARPVREVDAWLAVHADDHGCSGTDVDLLALSDRPVTRGSFASARAAAAQAAADATDAVDDRSGPEPVWSPEWATRGEFDAAAVAHRAAFQARRAARAAAATAARDASLARTGLVPVTTWAWSPGWLGAHEDWAATGSIDGIDTPGVPQAIASVDEHGCRCGHGGFSCDTDPDTPAPTTRAWIVADDRPVVFLATPAAEGFPAAATAVDAAARARAEGAAAAWAAARRFAPRSPAEIAGMDYAAYEAYQAARRDRSAHRVGPAPSAVWERAWAEHGWLVCWLGTGRPHAQLDARARTVAVLP